MRLILCPERGRSSVHVMNGDDTAVGHITRFIFNLDGGVLDMEAGGKDVTNQAENAVAFRERHIVNPNVARQSVSV